MRKRNWLPWVLFLGIALLAANIAFTRALRTESARRYLIGYLEASFGRRVNVERFQFNLLNGGQLEARSVTVSEDPRFGHEYFLRAEALTARPRWAALLTGHMELGTIALSRTSLNLVRDAQGRWNLESWLPAAGSSAYPGRMVGPAAGPAAAPADARTARLSRIDIQGGRINFKQGDDKSLLALLDVGGMIEQDTDGRWRLDLEARPMRAGVELQDIGTVRLRGTIAGTSARLQPANLNLTWREVSLADALRLARQVDYGMRGQLDVDLSARIGQPAFPGDAALQSVAQAENATAHAAQWSISGVARMKGVHGWTFPGRETDPAVIISTEAQWRIGEARAEISKILFEMPFSHIQGAGALDWGQGFQPRIHFDTSSVGLSDILAWYRAFRPNVAENLRAQGNVTFDASVAHWPLRLEQAALVTTGAQLIVPPSPLPLRIGYTTAKLGAAGIEFGPTQLTFVPVSYDLPSNPLAASPRSALPDSLAGDTLTVRGMIAADKNGEFHWPLNWNTSLDGGTSQVENWLAMLVALGQRQNTGWDASGALSVRVRGSRKSTDSRTVWLGTADSHDLILNPSYINQPIRMPRAHLELTAQQRTITLFATQALDATWHGTVARKLPDTQAGATSDAPWTFDLFADRLDAAQLDRWLGPRARGGLLARFPGLGILTGSVSEPERVNAVARLWAHGRLRVAEIVIVPLRLAQFDGEVQLAGRTMAIENARADFYGGKLAGKLNARLVADPAYDFQGRFDRVDLAELCREVPSLQDHVFGTASATLSLKVHGVGRQALIRSIEGAGTIDARDAELRGMDGAAQKVSVHGSLPASFSSVRGDFAIRGGGVDVSNLILENTRNRYLARGHVDYSSALHLSIRQVEPETSQIAGSAEPEYLLGGTVETPSLAAAEPAKPVIKLGTRGR